MRVEWTDRALADLDAIIDYYGQFGGEAARRVVGPVLAAAAKLETLPFLGAIAGDLAPQGQYRHLVSGNYRVIYRVVAETDTVIVLRIWDSRQDPVRLEPEGDGPA